MSGVCVYNQCCVNTSRNSFPHWCTHARAHTHTRYPGMQVLKLRKYLADGFPALVWRLNGQLCMITDELAEMLGYVTAHLLLKTTKCGASGVAWVCYLVCDVTGKIPIRNAAYAVCANRAYLQEALLYDRPITSCEAHVAVRVCWVDITCIPSLPFCIQVPQGRDVGPSSRV